MALPNFRNLLALSGHHYQTLLAPEKRVKRASVRMDVVLSHVPARSASRRIKRMIHSWHDVTPGSKLPQEFNSIIEIPLDRASSTNSTRPAD